MNLMNYPRTASSISHYGRPNSYELAGRELCLVMDNGYDYIFNFKENTCIWQIAEQSINEAGYICFKGDDTTFFISFEISQSENHTYVFDFTQRLVTQLICKKGLNPKNPHVMDRQFLFGAIKLPGYKLPYKRHTFSTESLGTTVQWRWSPELVTKHAYLESDWYRLTWEDGGVASDDFDAANEMLPSNDDCAKYVKIKENIFLFSLTEETAERHLGDLQRFRCDNLTLLQNYDRMYQVGRGFGDAVTADGLRHIFVPLAAYGTPIELSEEFVNAKNPFTV